MSDGRRRRSTTTQVPSVPPVSPQPVYQQPAYPQQTPPSGIRCPKCKQYTVDIQTHREDRGSVTSTKTISKYKEKGHGCLWWLFIGWWWWFIDLLLWIFMFFPRLIIQLLKKKKYVGKSKSVSTTVNNIVYKKIFVCKNCGYSWIEEIK